MSKEPLDFGEKLDHSLQILIVDLEIPYCDHSNWTFVWFHPHTYRRQTKVLSFMKNSVFQNF